jgi:hypothetical protein
VGAFHVVKIANYYSQLVIKALAQIMNFLTFYKSIKISLYTFPHLF